MESQLYFHTQQKSRLEELVAEHEELTLYGWQTDVLSILSRSAGPPDRRLIDVIVDKYGGHGKSQLSSILLSTSHGFISLSLGKRDDLLHAFVQAFHKSSTDVRGVVIDIPMYVVCGTEWDRQSYLDMASGRNAEKQIISHVKLLLKKKKEKGNEELKF